MTKLELKKLFSAWLDGKVIQLYEPNEKKWVNVKNPNWDTELEYRIKPKIELKDCNFNDEEYCTNEYGGVIKLNKYQMFINIFHFSPSTHCIKDSISYFKYLFFHNVNFYNKGFAISIKYL